MAGVYLHIPFCKQACHYCDFHFSTNTSSQKRMVNAISQELILQKDYLGNDKVETIYFGGGTPSLLSAEELRHLLETINNNFEISSSPEITLEANPDDLNFQKLRNLAKVGINRLSIGIQSFNNEQLSYLNRAHNSQEAKDCVGNAREVGIDNISIDLIYGIPSNNHDNWNNNLAQALALHPTHISSYCLTIENKTAFGSWLKKGKIQPINEEYAAQQFEILLSTLDDNGYEQYEISNFSLPDQHSKHNSNYWKHEKYLGVGPSAHSYNEINRQFNISNNAKYMDAIEQSEVPFNLDELAHKDHINEYLLTSLRTKWGVDLNKLKEKYQADLLNANQGYIQDLLNKGLASSNNNTLILTNKGKLFADKIASDLFFM